MLLGCGARARQFWRRQSSRAGAPKELDRPGRPPMSTAFVKHHPLAIQDDAVDRKALGSRHDGREASRPIMAAPRDKHAPACGKPVLSALMPHRCRYSPALEIAWLAFSGSTGTAASCRASSWLPAECAQRSRGCAWRLTRGTAYASHDEADACAIEFGSERMDANRL